MSDREHHFISGIVCDVCPAVIHVKGGTPENPNLVSRWGPEREELEQRAVQLGWQRWSSRSARDYCPTCAPKPGHSMRRIW